MYQLFKNSSRNRTRDIGNVYICVSRGIDQRETLPADRHAFRFCNCMHTCTQTNVSSDAFLARRALIGRPPTINFRFELPNAITHARAAQTNLRSSRRHNEPPTKKCIDALFFVNKAPSSSFCNMYIFRSVMNEFRTS